MPKWYALIHTGITNATQRVTIIMGLRSHTRAIRATVPRPMNVTVPATPCVGYSTISGEKNHDPLRNGLCCLLAQRSETRAS